MKKQIELLSSFWFNINWDSFYEYFAKKWVNVDNFNSSHLSYYVLRDEHNADLLEKLTWRRMEHDEFIKTCLKEKGEFNWIWSVTVPEYEPSLEVCWQFATESRAVLSIAHPNFKLTQEEFKERIEYYLDCWINAVEINSRASEDWVKLILKYQKKYWYILTFWSDCHFKVWDDKEHAWFWFGNKRIDEDLLGVNIYHFKKKIWLMDWFRKIVLRDELWDDIA